MAGIMIRAGSSGASLRPRGRPKTRILGPGIRRSSALALVLFAALTACGNESGRLSIEEGLTCAREAFKGHVGTFSQRGNTIAYRYESPNGRANVIVTFDERRRPVSTFFESAPLGSHEELMDAAQAIKICVAYGPKAREESDKSGATSMIGR